MRNVTASRGSMKHGRSQSLVSRITAAASRMHRSASVAVSDGYSCAHFIASAGVRTGLPCSLACATSIVVLLDLA